MVSGGGIHDMVEAEHPFWGYRGVWAWLGHREEMVFNQKRVRRVMKENGLMVTRRRHKAKRVARRSKPRADRPGEYRGIEMTKFIIPWIGWVYLVLVLD